VSSPPDQQRSLSAALDETMREASALSVLFSQAVADRVRLNPTDLESLDILIRSGPITAGRLAELTGLTTGAVTGLVDRLERRGYVVREPNPADRRSVVVRPLETPIARDIAPAYDEMRKAFEQLTSRYSDAEVRLVLDFMNRATAMTREQIAALRGNAWHRT
jgi:DNA-binding MarR family transcriptional regulator